MARALPDHLGKREIILPARYRVISDSSEGESEFETRRGTRRSSRLKGESAPVRMPTKGKPGNKKNLKQRQKTTKMMAGSLMRPTNSIQMMRMNLLKCMIK